MLMPSVIMISFTIKYIMLNVVVPSNAECRYAECRYAECRYAECRYAQCRGVKCSKKLIIISKLSC